MKMKILFATFITMLLFVGSASAATVSISSAAVAQDSSATVTIVAHNVTNLANFGLVLYFNQSIVHVTDIVNHPELSGAGMNEIHNESGYAAIASLNLFSLPSLNGDVVLANVTLKAVTSPTSESFLNLVVGRLQDNTNADIAVTGIINGTFTIVPKGDVDGYAGITMADAMWIGKAAEGISGFPEDITTMDIDDDGDVTIEDARRVAQFVVGNRETL